MSLLSIAKSVAKKIGIEVPEALAAATDDTSVVLYDAILEAAEKVVDAHDWQLLKRLQTETGDGSTSAFDLPSDFHRMPNDGHIWSSRLRQPFTEFTNDEWLDYEVRAVPFVYGSYTKLGGQFLIKPVMASGETAKYYYQSNLLWNNGTANVAEPTTEGAVTQDANTWRLDDRLLMLCAVWSWKHDRGLPYEQHYMEYQKALGHAIERDRGPTVVDFGATDVHRDVKPAFPWTISGTT